MTAELLSFVHLSGIGAGKGTPLPPKEDRAGVVVALDGEEGRLAIYDRDRGPTQVALSPETVTTLKRLLERAETGGRVAVLSEERELTPNQVARILGISRPLVVHRMEVGDLPFRYVGKHRRARLSDVLALKQRLDEQQRAIADLAVETERLAAEHGL